MANIVKEPTILVKCSSDQSINDQRSITCMPLESSTKMAPICMIWIYRNRDNLSEQEFMPSDKLQLTLSNALNSFPILSGRLTEDSNGNATIHFTNEGVLFTKAKCLNQTLDYFIPQDENEEFDYEHINEADFGVPVSADWTGPMMSIQITRLQCHSVILTITAFHCLMDAQSTADFLNAWASKDQIPVHRPMFEKSFVQLSPEEQLAHGPITRPVDCVFNREMRSSLAIFPFAAEEAQQKIIAKVYYFSVDELENLKEEAMKDIDRSKVDFISTYDALYAHMILVIANATETPLQQDNPIKILQSLNGRPLFAQSLSLESIRYYFGSFPFWLMNEIPKDMPINLSSLAQLIHRMHQNQTLHSLKCYNAYLCSDDGNIRKNRVDADLINRDFHCASWRKVRMLEANFQNDENPSNYPIYSGPAKQLYPRYFAMLDKSGKDQSIAILLGLKEKHYHAMMQQNLLHKYRSKQSN